MDAEASKDFCEGNLYRGFKDGVSNLRDKNLKLRLYNEVNHTWQLEVIDFQNFIGVEIDRQANKSKGVREFNPFMMDLPNITIFTPSNPMNMFASLFKNQGTGKPMMVSGISIEILVKIRTNLKLDLIGESSSTTESLIPASRKTDDEIHYVKFEGFYPEFELSPESLKRGMTNLEFKDWTIVDFDNYLKGNSHLS